MPNPTDIEVPYKGSRHAIRHAQNKNGRTLARKFLDGLQRRDLAKFYGIIVTLADEGQDNTSEEQLKKLTANIWEIRVLYPGLRLLCFPHNNDWYLTHGCKKLSRKEFQIEIAKAERIRLEHLSRS